MHAWLKLACAVLAWTILPAGVITAGPGRSAHPVQASTRTTSIGFTSAPVRVALTSSSRPAAASAPAALTSGARPGATASASVHSYVVQPGDTLSAIATRFGIRGGWPALYAANRSRVGANPDTLAVGVVLHLPGPAAPVRYTVAAGDSLSAIAARFEVRGGWPALYAANRPVIGPDPGAINAGTRLTIPGPATPPASAPAPGQPAPSQPAPSQPAPSQPAPGSKPAPSQTHPQPTGPAPSSVPSAPPTVHQAHPRPHASSGMPSWLKTMLLAVGLLAVVIFAAEPLLVARRRRRRRIVVPTPPDPSSPPSHSGPASQASPVQQETPVHQDTPADQAHQTSTHPARPYRASSAPEAPVMPVPTDQEAHQNRIPPARIVVADHDRLVITRNKHDDTICVLRPPGEDPADILRVARLVLPEGPYGTLADQLGMPASWPMNQ
jgi:LysM repeat protein